MLAAKLLKNEVVEGDTVEIKLSKDGESLDIAKSKG
jgi:hypothetical protein